MKLFKRPTIQDSLNSLKNLVDKRHAELEESTDPKGLAHKRLIESGLILSNGEPNPVFQQSAIKSEYSRKLEILKSKNWIVRTLMKDSEDENLIPKHLRQEFRDKLNSIQL